MFLDNEDYYYDPIVDIKIHYLQNYTNVFDLGNTLVDLQALVSGITRLCEDDSGLFYGKELYNERENHISRHEIIKAIILDEIPEKNSVNIDELSKRIEEQFPPEKAAQQSVRAYSTISRSFSRKYKDLVRLNSFAQGSLILDIATSVISGLILKFVERLFGNETPMQVTINNNFIIIDDNNKCKKVVRVEECRGEDTLNHIKGMTIDQYFDSVLSSVEINNKDVHKSVMSLLHKLSEQQVLSTRVIYNERGIKTLTNDIERMRGTLLDVSI